MKYRKMFIYRIPLFSYIKCNQTDFMDGGDETARTLASQEYWEANQEMLQFERATE